MALVKCTECGHDVSTDALSCPHCGHSRVAPIHKSDSTAALLGLFFGPVGLWYKGHWGAGFIWLFVTVVLAAASAFILAPFCWIGMAIHAYRAVPAGMPMRVQQARVALTPEQEIAERRSRSNAFVFILLLVVFVIIALAVQST